jgi:hypothetical protein
VDVWIAFNRFSSIYDTPMVMRTDNGTNFGASYEAEKAKIQATQKFEWLFNTLHQGGTWERVKSVKERLLIVLQ